MASFGRGSSLSGIAGATSGQITRMASNASKEAQEYIKTRIDIENQKYNSSKFNVMQDIQASVKETQTAMSVTEAKDKIADSSFANRWNDVIKNQ